MVSECPESELRAMESVCCERCVGKPGREEGKLKDGPCGYGKKEGDMLLDCRGKVHQTMRLSVMNAACYKVMSRGFQEMG